VNRLHCCGFALVLFLSVSAQAVDFPAPPDSVVTSVSNSTTVFGMTMKIRRFETRKSKADVVDFYARRWEDNAVITLMEPWEMIGKVEGKQYLNVQVQTGLSGSWGFLSISNLPEQIEKDRLEVPGTQSFPKMAGSTVISDQEHQDPMKTARTLVLTNSFSVGSNSQFYRKHYQGQGWQLVADTAGTKVKGAAMTFSKGRKLLLLTINRVDATTSVVANIEHAKLLR